MQGANLLFRSFLFKAPQNVFLCSAVHTHSCPRQTLSSIKISRVFAIWSDPWKSQRKRELQSERRSLWALQHGTTRESWALLFGSTSAQNDHGWPVWQSFRWHVHMHGHLVLYFSLPFLCRRHSSTHSSTTALMVTLWFALYRPCEDFLLSPPVPESTHLCQLDQALSFAFTLVLTMFLSLADDLL